MTTSRASKTSVDLSLPIQVKMEGNGNLFILAKGAWQVRLLHVACLHALHVFRLSTEPSLEKKFKEKTSLFVGDYDAAL